MPALFVPIFNIYKLHFINKFVVFLRLKILSNYTMKSIYPVLLAALLFNCTSKENDALRYEKETHLKNIKQLTFGGDNAEAYWSYDNTKLVFQANNPEWETECDQIFYMDDEENTTNLKGERVYGREVIYSFLYILQKFTLFFFLYSLS